MVPLLAGAQHFEKKSMAAAFPRSPGPVLCRGPGVSVVDS